MYLSVEPPFILTLNKLGLTSLILISFSKKNIQLKIALSTRKNFLCYELRKSLAANEFNKRQHRAADDRHKCGFFSNGFHSIFNIRVVLRRPTSVQTAPPTGKWCGLNQ